MLLLFSSRTPLLQCRKVLFLRLVAFSVATFCFEPPVLQWGKPLFLGLKPGKE